LLLGAARRVLLHNGQKITSGCGPVLGPVLIAGYGCIARLNELSPGLLLGVPRVLLVLLRRKPPNMNPRLQVPGWFRVRRVVRFLLAPVVHVLPVYHSEGR